MIFAEFFCEAAVGVVLARGLRLPHRALDSGHVLGAEDVETLRRAGVTSVHGVRLESSDVARDEAAVSLARMLLGPHIALGAVSDGRCSLLAMDHGVVVLERERLDRINLLDEAIAVAAVAPYQEAAAGALVASVNVPPVAVRGELLEACAAFALQSGPVLSLAPYRPQRAALIVTELAGSSAHVETAVARIEELLAARGSTLGLVLHCAHQERAIVQSQQRALAAGAELLLIAGAIPTADRRDIVPAALARAGGIIDHFGMPMEPGGRVLLGHQGSVPIVDLSGALPLHHPSGLDRLLQRLLAGLPVTGRDMMLMGAGGLL